MQRTPRRFAHKQDTFARSQARRWRAAQGTSSQLQQSYFFTHRFKGGERTVHFLALELGAHLHADTRGAFRYDRKAEARHEDPVREQVVAHRDGKRRVADDDRNDRAFAFERIEAQGPQLLAKIRYVVAQAVHQLGMLFEVIDRRERAARDGSRQRVGKELRTRPLYQRIDQCGASGYEAAGGAAERLAQRTGDDVDPAFQAEVLDRAASGLAHHAGTVRIVDDCDGAVFLSQLDDLRKFCQAAFHRKDAVGDDDDGRAILRGLEFRLQVVHVAVLVALATRFARQAAAVDDRSVVELVREQRGAFFANGRKEAGVGIPARDVRERSFGTEELRDPLLELAMNVERSADESYRRRAGAVFLQASLARFNHRRLVRKPEVVVAGKDDDVAGFFHVHFGRHRRRKVPQRFVGPRGLELFDAGFQFALERRVHRAMSPLRSRTIFAASPLFINSKARSYCASGRTWVMTGRRSTRPLRTSACV